MEINFKYEYLDTDIFEKEYEIDLQEEHETRKDIIKYGLVVYIYLDDVLIGESFGISPYEYMCVVDRGQGMYDEDDAIVDADMSDKESVYVWSTTILPAFRGKGYGKRLREEFARYASHKGYAKLIGHATTQDMVHIIRGLGGIFHLRGIHEEWFGTNRTARFYTQFLTQTKEYNCGPFALAYLLETKGHTFSIEYLEKRLHTTNEYGTSPEDIEAFLETEIIPYERCKKLAPLSMIDVNRFGDGHWITLINQASYDYFNVYDPDLGFVCESIQGLDQNWHSPRYGKYKGFTLL